MANATVHAFTVVPSGPFDLAHQNGHFGGWPELEGDPGAVVLAFAVEGTQGAAAVVLRQAGDGVVTGEVHGVSQALAPVAWRQALAATSLDADGSGWAAVGERDPVLGRLQDRYRHLRPVLFHSPYEAAAAFVIGHRISIKQTRALRARISAEHGTAITVDGQAFSAFPTPAQLLRSGALPGVSATKRQRLEAIAHAAHDGWLQRENLQELPRDVALEQLQTLPGIGPFFAQGILHRGAGTVDVLIEDDNTRFAVTQAYELPGPVHTPQLRTLAQAWHPYRTWAVVLLHVWVRAQVGLPSRRPVPR